MPKIVLATIKLLAFICAVEALFFAFGIVTMHRGNPYRLYSPARLYADIENILPIERAGSITGWPADGSFPKRPHLDIGLPTCGSAWGGSFTWSDDVPDDEAWPQLLSIALGCQIDNRGVDGFALDQTLIHYRAHPSINPSIVVLGLSSPMIMMDAESSFTFVSLNPDKSPKASLTKPRFVDRSGQLELINRPRSRLDAIRNYLINDASAYDWETLAFPFTYHVCRAIFRKFAREPFFDLTPGTNAPEIERLRALAVDIVNEMEGLARSRHDKLVLLLLPDPANGFDNSLLYVRNHTRSDVCIIDPSDELATAGPLRGPSGHFNTAGNKALATALARGIKACGITT